MLGGSEIKPGMLRDGYTITKIQRYQSGRTVIHYAGSDRTESVLPGRRVQVERPATAPTPSVAESKRFNGATANRKTSVRLVPGDQIRVERDTTNRTKSRPATNIRDSEPVTVVSNQRVAPSAPSGRQVRQHITVRHADGTTSVVNSSPSQTHLKRGGDSLGEAPGAETAPHAPDTSYRMQHRALVHRLKPWQIREGDQVMVRDTGNYSAPDTTVAGLDGDLPGTVVERHGSHNQIHKFTIRTANGKHHLYANQNQKIEVYRQSNGRP